MLNSTKQEISTAHKTEIPTNEAFLALSLSDVIFIMLINVKMPTIVGILTFMSMINFMLGSFEHDKSFITSGPVFWIEPVLIRLFRYFTSQSTVFQSCRDALPVFLG